MRTAAVNQLTCHDMCGVRARNVNKAREKYSNLIAYSLN